jgi:hypothetical protein
MSAGDNHDIACGIASAEVQRAPERKLFRLYMDNPRTFLTGNFDRIICGTGIDDDDFEGL